MRRTMAGPTSSTGSYKPQLDPGKSLPSKEGGSPSDFYSRQAGVGDAAPAAPPADEE